ncbi:hypothetical protein T484DRAFT_1965415 [Baffinella frigidus]|nr:hypothetical protein T484DRAFT_1965415 [Cryptophyta sp. CCMP2293]
MEVQSPIVQSPAQRSALLALDCELVTGPFGGTSPEVVLLQLALGHSGNGSMSQLSALPIELIQREIAPLIRQKYMAMLATPSVKQRFNGGLSKHMAPPQVRPALRPALKPRSAFRRLAMPDLDHGRATATTSMLDPPHARPITTSMLDRHAVLAEHVASRQLDKLEVRGPASSGPKLCACGRCQGDGARDEAVSTGSPL